MPPDAPPAGREFATLAGGCFWCLEAVFDRLAGVESVESGYMGGQRRDPTYEEVCTGATGHAEVVQVTFDPAVVTFRDLLEIFFTIHDPTTPGRQGNDVGSQYRSALFPLDEAQRTVAQAYLDQLQAAGVYASPLATTLEPLEAFFVAEAYHHDYAAKNPGKPYIQFVSLPKVAKLVHAFPDRLK